MAKKKKFDALLLRQVGTFNQETLYNKEFQKQQLNKHRKQLQYYGTTKQEKQLWQRFKGIVKQKRKETKAKHLDAKVHFSFDHIEELGVEWDLLIIMGEKNIGKTYAQSQLVRKTIEENPHSKIFLMRTTQKELAGALKSQLEEKHWPFTVARSSKLPSPLKWKKHEIKPPGLQNLKDYYVGWCTHVNGNGLVACQGPTYEGLRYAIWDEFNDDKNLKLDFKEPLLRFFQSIQRDNKNFQLIMSGNLLSKKDVANHVLLDQFKIPFDAKLKYRAERYFDKKNKKPIYFKLLYINIGGVDELYDGVQTQSFTYMFGEEAARDLLTNLPAYKTTKVVNKFTFLESKPWFSFVVTYENIPYVIYIAQAVIEWSALKTSYYYVMHVDYYTKDDTELGYTPISDEITTTNLFGRLLKSWSEIIADKFQTLQNIIEAGALYFSNDPTRELFNNKLYPMLVRKYKDHLEEWF